MTVYIGSIANQRKVSKWLPFKNYKLESLNMICIYGGHICMCIPRMKFLCLSLCQVEVYTDDDANDDDTNDDGQFMIV